MGQVGFHRTVPLVLHGTGGIGRTHRIEGIGGAGRIPKDCPTCPTWDRSDGHIGLRVLVGQVGFQRTVPLVLHGTSGIGRTHRIEGVDGTARIPWDCPTCPTWDRWEL